ncbi:hypothetical protein L1887_14698 [Cichorium endivia]|nr:hypothetical protein L1887_14698 [Cichorium endivia]
MFLRISSVLFPFSSDFSTSPIIESNRRPKASVPIEQTPPMKVSDSLKQRKRTNEAIPSIEPVSSFGITIHLRSTNIEISQFHYPS